MRAHWATLGWMLLAIAGCHSDKTEHEPTSAEATQGGDDPIYDTPDGTVGPNVGTGTPPPGEGLGPGSEGPPDIVGGAGGVGGTGAGGDGGGGGLIDPSP